MNHDNTQDTEIVPGDEGDVPPIDSIGLEPNAGSDVEKPVEMSGIASEEANDVAPVVMATEAPDSRLQPEQGLEGQVVVVEEPLVLPEPKFVEPQVTVWQQIRNVLFGGSARTATRLDNLTQAIEGAPEAPVNYVLRAELYTGMREYALAQADFQRAVELAATQFELADWGLLDQAMRDRAIAGLEKVQRRLR